MIIDERRIILSDSTATPTGNLEPSVLPSLGADQDTISPPERRKAVAPLLVAVAVAGSLSIAAQGTPRRAGAVTSSKGPGPSRREKRRQRMAKASRRANRAHHKRGR